MEVRVNCDCIHYNASIIQRTFRYWMVNKKPKRDF